MSGAQDVPRAALEHAARSAWRPTSRVACGRAGTSTSPSKELELERCEPDLVGGLADGRRSSARISRQARSARGCAGSDKQLLAGAVRGTMREGAGETRRGGEYTSGAGRGATARGPLTQSAGKSSGALEGRRRARDRIAGESARACVYCVVPSRFGLVSHETHLPAEEAQARPHPRFPRPDADPRRAPHAQAPARQGPQAADGVMRRGWAGRVRARPGAGGCRAAPTSIGSSATAALTPAATRAVRVPARRRRTPLRGWACRCRARSVARSSATASSGCCARHSRVEGERLPAGTDAVVVARHGAKDLAEREGLAGIRRALGELDRARCRARSAADRGRLRRAVAG